MTTNAKGKYTVPGKLAKLIAEKRADLEALERVEEMLVRANGHGGAAAANRIIGAALSMDEERRTTHGGPRKKKQPPYDAGKHAERRKATARFLARVAKSGEKPYKPNAIDHGRVSVLLQHKYIKAQDDGYIRTDKVFTP